MIILPLISRDLKIPATRQQWVVSAYALTVGSFLLLWGKLGDVYGKRLLFILGALWFGATALGAAFSPTEICMYTMRALQGVVSIIIYAITNLADVDEGCCDLHNHGHWHHWLHDPAWSSQELLLCFLLWWCPYWTGAGEFTGLQIHFSCSVAGLTNLQGRYNL